MNRLHLSSSLGVVFASMLQACGGGGSSDPDTMGRTDSNNAHLTISITDAPVTNVSEVWVQITGLRIKPADGEAIDFTFSTPRNINLLNLYGGRSEVLISNESIPGGAYEWIRLQVNAVNDGVMDSYLVLNNGSTYELDIPTNRTTGLRINNIGSIAANSNPHLTIDFDLSKSLVLASGEYKLKPVLRLINNDLSGSISSVIDAGLLTTNCSDSDPDTGNAVYVFANNATPDDIDGDSSDPITVARVLYNSMTGDYEYEAAFLPEGNYTVAFTCQADMDDPEAENTLIFSNVSNNVNVEADEDEDDDDSHEYR